MTIPSTASEIEYAGDDVSDEFAIPFVFDTAADIKVIRTDSDGNPVELSSGFSITGGGGSAGTLTLDDPLESGYTLTILDDPDLTQPVDYADNDAFPAETHEGALDRTVRQVKRLYQLIRNSARVPDGDPARGDSMIFPTVEARRGFYARWADSDAAALEPAASLGADTPLSQSIIGALLYPQTTAESSAGVTPANKEIPSHQACGFIHPERYGLTGSDSSTDTTAAANALLVAAQLIQPTVYAYTPFTQNAKLTVPAETKIVLRHMTKGFNGDMISLGLRSELTGSYLNGNGANFTGRGVLIETGSGGDGWQNIHDNTILDTESYCIEYTASGAGWASRIVNNRLGVYNRPTTPAIKLPPSGNGPRLILGNVTLGPLVDLSGAESPLVVGNIGGEDAAMTVPTIDMDSSVQLGVIVGNQLESNTGIQMTGDRMIWAGNMMRDGYSLEAGATDAFIAANFGGAVVDNDVDNSGSPSNVVYGIHHTYTPTWTGSISNPAIGDGTLTARYQRIGRRVHLQIDLLAGSTTTYGSGFWTFSLPPGVAVPGNGNSYGVATMVDSSTGVHRIGVVTVDGTDIGPITADSEVNGAGPSVPFTWAAGDALRIDVTYNI